MNLLCKLFGHKFENIFDTVKGAPTINKIGYEVTFYQLQDLISRSKPVTTTYVYTICNRCGTIIHRETK